MAAVVAALAACGSDQGARTSGATSLEVVASTNVYGDVVRQIVGDVPTDVRVTSIISDPSQDPHSYEASTQNQLALSRADLVVENGGGYDDFVDTLLKRADRGGNADATVLNAVAISGRRPAADGELNEHVWYDFPTVDRLANRIAAALAAADPAHRADYTANAAAFTQKIKRLEAAEAAIKQAHAGDGVAITEPVPGYLLAAGGLVDRTPEAFSEAIEEGTDVPVAALRQTLGLFTGRQVKALVYNSQASGPETEKVLAAARTNGVAVVPVTETLPAGKDYVSWMTGNVAALRTALG